MKIGIDISAVIYGTGVSVYIKNLVEKLLELDSKNDYVLFGGSLRRGFELKSFAASLKRRNLQEKILPIPPTLANMIWNRLHILPIERLIGSIDVFHSSDWTQPPSKAFKVTTIHDLSPILFPELTHPKIVETHTKRLFWVKNEADRVIVPSNATANDAIKLGIQKERLRVIPEAVEPGMERVSRQKIDNLKRKYRITGKFLLAVGVNRRKNTQKIIKAFERIRALKQVRLVIIGHKHSDFEAPRGVVFLGHIPNSELASFYSAAEVLVYPSLYEGFGLPVLYSFSCQTPVVTSNFGSMAEIAGRGAVLVDPKDTDSITDGILKAMSGRAHFVKLGLREASKYSWENTASETLKVYKEAGS